MYIVYNIIYIYINDITRKERRIRLNQMSMISTTCLYYINHITTKMVV